MFRHTKKAVAGLIAAAAVMFAAVPAMAAVDPETAYVFNTFSFLFNGALVMWMAAGFAMLESGLVRSKNTATICLKNIALYSIAGIMFYLVGYSLMYTDVSGYIGSFALFYNPSDAELTLLGAEEATSEMVDAVVGGRYSVASDWFFQMVFVATAASIVSGTLAERIKLWPFLIFVIVLTAIIYPIQGSWTWGGGWLAEMGFSDFAGSTIVHSVGGWAAVTGALILGARKGKYGPDGRVNPMPGANLPLATLGTFILWLGWFGFNGGSQLALGSALDATAMAIVFTNTNLAAAGGVVAAMLMTQIMYKKVDLTMALNGALAGLVSITAGPDLTNHFMSIIIGGIGGILVVIAIPLLDKLKIDDVVGAISVHLVAGIWGTLAVGIFGAGMLGVQIIGIVAIAAFVIITSSIVWLVLKYTMAIRVSE
jgi:ammonium transporter, Amt family